MPTIVFAQSKGGAGKTTAAITLAGEIALGGASVTMIDADPNQHTAKWATKPGCPENVTLRDNPPGRKIEENIIDDIEEARRRSAFVIVDLEGSRNMAAGYAISRADLAIICLQGSGDDADECAKTIQLIRQQEKAFNIEVPFVILITRAPAALNPKLLRDIIRDLESQDVPILKNRLIDREAFKVAKAYGGTLHDLKPNEVSGAAKAIEDAQAFAGEVVERLRRQTAKTTPTKDEVAA